MSEIKIEEVQYEFITEGFLRPVAPIRRFSQGNNRFYYRVEENGEVTLFSSGTTLISDGYAESSAGLEDWRNKLKADGKDPVYELMYAAMRGTMMHILIGDFIQQIPINLSNLSTHFSLLHPEVTSQAYYEQVLLEDTLWLQKSVMAFAQFVKDFKVKPLAIELILTSEKYRVASPVDMICSMTIEEKGFFGETYKSGARKGEPKETKREREITAIVDFKSSKSFFDKHALQLKLYRQMVKECYPDLKVEGLYNWSPKDWTGVEPTYNLKEQSGGRLEDLAEAVFLQGSIKHKWKTPTVNIVPDSLKYGEDINFEQVLLVDYLKDKHGKGTDEEAKEKGSK